MKTVFFDTKDYEIEFFEEKLTKATDRIYLKYPLKSDIDFSEIKDAEIISCSINSFCNPKTLFDFKNLKCIMTRSMGFDHIDLKYCKSRGIQVYNIPHYGDWTVAEYVFALILSSSRNIIPSSYDLKTGQVDLPKYMGLELHSKTIGIIGLGQIGERVAHIAQGFNMKVLYFDIKEVEEYKKVSLEVLLKSSDFITINCPLNKDTKHLLSFKEFEIMKDNAVLINTARGEIINTKALIDAMEKGKISYLGLDVLECEFETNNYGRKNFCINCVEEKCLRNYILNQKLMCFKNAVITPHIAYNTKEAVIRILNTTVKNIEHYIKNDLDGIKQNHIM